MNLSSIRVCIRWTDINWSSVINLIYVKQAVITHPLSQRQRQFRRHRKCSLINDGRFPGSSQMDNPLSQCLPLENNDFMIYQIQIEVYRNFAQAYTVIYVRKRLCRLPHLYIIHANLFNSRLLYYHFFIQVLLEFNLGILLIVHFYFLRSIPCGSG